MWATVARGLQFEDLLQTATFTSIPENLIERRLIHLKRLLARNPDSVVRGHGLRFASLWIIVSQLFALLR